MNKLNVKTIAKWRFKKYPYIQVSKDLNIVNTRTNKKVKHHTRGYYVVDKYYKRHELNDMLELIPKTECSPF